jgi:hypothetical protein
MLPNSILTFGHNRIAPVTLRNSAKHSDPPLFKYGHRRSTWIRLFQTFQVNRIMQCVPSADTSSVCIMDNNCIQANLSKVKTSADKLYVLILSQNHVKQEAMYTSTKHTRILLPFRVVFFFTSNLFIFFTRVPSQHFSQKAYNKQYKIHKHFMKYQESKIHT